MSFLWGLLTVLLGGILYISFRGAPFVPTLKPQVKKALDLAGLKPGMTIIDLGSGDGRLLLAAARRGCYAIGYELNPLLVLYSKLRCYSVRRQVKVELRDFWLVPLPDTTDVIFVFLAKPFMEKLERHLKAESRRLQKPLVLISFGFKLPNKKPEAQNGPTFRYLFTPKG